MTDQRADPAIIRSTAALHFAVWLVWDIEIPALGLRPRTGAVLEQAAKLRRALIPVNFDRAKTSAALDPDRSCACHAGLRVRAPASSYKSHLAVL